jgi:AcrR family transcriptional regulator
MGYIELNEAAGADRASVGRPRSEAIHRQMMDAVIGLLQEKSIQATSIEAAARAAGVGKATIYRWRDDKLRPGRA